MNIQDPGRSPQQDAPSTGLPDAPGMPDAADALLSKADALLGRYRPSATAQATTPVFSDPADFPVLTDVVELPQSETEPAATGFPPQSASDGAAPVTPLPMIDETRLREEILATLAPELEQRLSDTLKPRANELLDWAMQTVQLELGLSIRAAVRSAVASAVDEALEKHRRSSRPE
jgi:hypothetical protein